MPAPLLHVDGLCVSANSHNLLNELSISLAVGEILAVVGPNGAGKTTLLKAIVGDLKASSGEVKIFGKNINDWPVRERAQRLAILPQFSLLNFPYTVEEVVALGRIPHTSGVRADKHIVQSAMELVDIKYLSDRLYTQLSGGEKQRTQLARVMAQVWPGEVDDRTKILLLDEPTASLDLGHRQLLMEAVRNFASRSVAVVMVVHDINLANRYADYLIALACGRVLTQGPVDEVISVELIKKLFGAEVDVVAHLHNGKNYILS